MNLFELVLKVGDLNQEETIYAKQPWSSESEAVVRIEDEELLIPKDLELEGYDYFLEVDSALELKKDLIKAGSIKDDLSICNRIIQYAINDA